MVFAVAGAVPNVPGWVQLTSEADSFYRFWHFAGGAPARHTSAKLGNSRSSWVVTLVTISWKPESATIFKVRRMATEE